MLRRSILSVSLLIALFTICVSEARAEITLGPPQALELLRTRVPISVSLAVLEDGSFAIGGSEVRPFQPNNPRFRFTVQFFSPAGLPLGEPISPGGTAYVHRGSVGSVGDRYFVTWENVRGVTKSGFFDSRGRSFGKFFSWPRSEVVDFQRWYRFAPAPSHRILPLTFRQLGIDGFDNPIFQPIVQVFDRRAHPMGPAFHLEPITANRSIEIEALAINGEGRLLVVSLQCPASPRSRQPCLRGVQSFDGAGRVLKAFSTEEIPQLDPGLEGAIGLRAAVRANGSFLLSWIDGYEAGAFRMLIRPYSRDATPTAPPRVIAKTGANSLISTVDLETIGTHGYLATWLIRSQSPYTASVSLRQFDASGEPSGEPVLVTTDEITTTPVLAFNSSGHGIIYWSTRHQQEFGGRFRLITVTRAARGESG